MKECEYECIGVGENYRAISQIIADQRKFVTKQESALSLDDLLSAVGVSGTYPHHSAGIGA